MEALAYFASPYQLNPFNINPLKKLFEEFVDFERVRRQDAVKLFLSATDVRTAKVKVFSGKELRAEHVLASTCLPLMMQAVEVDGEYYWDGGYSGNPAIFPLVYECEIAGHRPGPPDAGRPARSSDLVAGDHESHAGDQLQYRADPRDALGRRAQPANRRRHHAGRQALRSCI